MILSDDRRKVLLTAFADYFVTLGDPDTGGWIRELAEKKSARIDPENEREMARVDERTDSPLPVTTAGNNTLPPSTVSDPQVSHVLLQSLDRAEWITAHLDDHDGPVTKHERYDECKACGATYWRG